MRFVNKTRNPMYTTLSGLVGAGKMSADNYMSRGRQNFIVSLREIVKVCGKKMCIRLNDEELGLINSLLDLHKEGMAFKPVSIPRPRNPYEDAQAERLKAIIDANRKKKETDDLINGEVKGKEDSVSQKIEKELLGGGFAEILRENQKIAKGEKISPTVAANPMGKEFREINKARLDGATRPQQSEVVPPENKNGSSEDFSKGASAKAPEIAETVRAGDMDAKAAATAQQLAFEGTAVRPPKPEEKAPAEQQEGPKEAEAGKKTRKSRKSAK